MKKRRLTDFLLTEISGVDNPAQPTAKMSIMKRHDFVSKYLDCSTAANIQSFPERLKLNEQEKILWQTRDNIYPLFDALNSTVSNVVSDGNLSISQKELKIASIVNDFYISVVREIPDLEQELIKFLKRAGTSGNLPDGENMSAEELKKSHAEEVAKFEAEKAELAKKLAEVEAVAKMDDSEKLVYKAMSDKEKAEWLKLSEDEKKKKKEEMSKRDETIVVDGASVSKSVVGDAMFAVLKRQSDLEAQVAKANESVEMARLEKRAVEEFGKMAGTPAEIANVLKSIKSLDETVVKFVEGLMTKENELAKKASETIGTKQDAVAKSDTTTKAVTEIMKRDNVSQRVAMETVVKERPELFN